MGRVVCTGLGAETDTASLACQSNTAGQAELQLAVAEKGEKQEQTHEQC